MLIFEQSSVRNRKYLRALSGYIVSPRRSVNLFQFKCFGAHFRAYPMIWDFFREFFEQCSTFFNVLDWFGKHFLIATMSVCEASLLRGMKKKQRGKALYRIASSLNRNASFERLDPTYFPGSIWWNEINEKTYRRMLLTTHTIGANMCLRPSMCANTSLQCPLPQSRQTE